MQMANIDIDIDIDIDTDIDRDRDRNRNRDRDRDIDIAPPKTEGWCSLYTVHGMMTVPFIHCLSIN